MINSGECVMIPEKYGKPNMTNLSGKMGKKIHNRILQTPPPNRKELLRQADELEKRIIKAEMENE